MAAVGPSLLECKDLGIVTQEDALEFLSSKVKIRRIGQNPKVVQPKERLQNGIDFLSASFLCHVPSNTGVMKAKAVYLGLMVRRYVFILFFYCFR